MNTEIKIAQGLAAALARALAFTATQTRAAVPAPRLVLQITVDQFRSVLPERYVKQMVSFDMKTVLMLAVTTLLPILPLLLTMVPLEELLNRLLKIVF